MGQWVEVITASTVLDRLRSEETIVARLSTWVALLALLVTLVGTSATAATYVAQERRDMAIRAAIGATPRRIAALVASRAMAVFVLGASVGLLAYGLIGSILQARVFGLSAFEPAVMGGVVVGLGAAALLTIVPQVLEEPESIPPAYCDRTRKLLK